MKTDKINRIVFLSLLLFSLSILNLYGEDLKKESESLEHAWFLGGSFVPFSHTNAGRTVSDDIEKDIDWSGRGLTIESMYILGLYYGGYDAEIFLSLNNTLGVVQWMEKEYAWDDIQGERKFDSVELNKGYSAYISQKIRGSMITYRLLGLYMDAGIAAVYFHPQNLDTDESIERELKIGFILGMGIYLGIPFPTTQIFFELGADLITFFDNYRDRDNELDMVCIKMTALFEFF